MLILNKTFFVILVSFIISVAFGYFFLPYIKKKKAEQHVSLSLPQHKNKNLTPTLGGLIFIIPTLITIILLYLFDMLEFNYNLWIVLLVFVGYGIIGFIDDIAKIKAKNNKGISRKTKLIIQFLIASVFFYIFMKNGAEPTLWIYTLGIKIHLGWVYGIFILCMLVGSSNAVNLTDGLDGLCGGLSFIAFIAFGLIAWGTGWLEGYESIAYFCFALCGSLLGFLNYNTHPAKIFMGDTGSLALGGALATIAILTRHELSYFVIAGVFIIEILSSLIQIVAIRKFKKRVFKMAPIHHHFEKLGWEEKDIVRRFWGVGLILAMAAIAFGVWI